MKFLLQLRDCCPALALEPNVLALVFADGAVGRWSVTRLSWNAWYYDYGGPAVVEFEGITYPHVEGAYQSAKTLDMNERRRIAAIADPAEAKRAGRALKYRDDWEAVKFDVMETCVRYKFTHHPELRAKLLATGNAVLEEGNNWDDRIWGVVDGVGENRLGKILMKVRDELRRTP